MTDCCSWPAVDVSGWSGVAVAVAVADTSGVPEAGRSVCCVSISPARATWKDGLTMHLWVGTVVYTYIMHVHVHLLIVVLSLMPWMLFVGEGGGCGWAVMLRGIRKNVMYIV